MANPYSILGIPKSASEAEIKSAYRKLAKELHPDRNKDKPNAAERFSNVTKAYDLLSDKQRRAQFDRGEIDLDGNPAHPFGGMGGGFGGRGSRQGFNPGGFQSADIDLGDLFGGIFGGGRAQSRSGMGAGFGGGRPSQPKKGADINYRLLVPFIDAASQIEQQLTLADGKTVKVKIPAGAENGTQLRLRGKGQVGPGGAGDGLVTIQISNHAFYKKDGDHVRVSLPITLDEALNGAKIKCPTLQGTVLLTIKPGTSGGATMRLKGKGWSKKGGGYGDLLVTLNIQLPKDGRELVKRLDGWKDESDPRRDLGV
jgi:DnaJ-class molecular chaperone